MRYEFTKMQSLGNDFIVLDGVSDAINLTAETAKRLADRHFGVGCDQVLLVQADAEDAARFVFRIFNQDGSEAEQCGNGARCLARFLVARGLTKRDTMRVRTRKQWMTLRINADESVTVDMGKPEFSPQKIPFVTEVAEPPRANAKQARPTNHARHTATAHTLTVDGEAVQVSVVAIGNPHAVQRVPSVAAAAVETLGGKLTNHAQFPQQANIGFMQVVAKDHIRLRVYERGVGETLGCGSGACAAVAIGIINGWLDNKVTVSLPGGNAEVTWRQRNQSMLLTGPAHTVFHGRIEL